MEQILSSLAVRRFSWLDVFVWACSFSRLLWSIRYPRLDHGAARNIAVFAGLAMIAILLNVFVVKSKQRWLTGFAWLAMILSLLEPLGW